MIEEKDDMKTRTKFMLPLFMAIISICTGMALANGENVTNMTNVTNMSNMTNVTIVTGAPVIPVAAVVTMTPATTVTPVTTVIISTPVVTQNITVTPVVTPNVTVASVVIVTTPAPVVTQNIVTEQAIPDNPKWKHAPKQKQNSEQIPVATIGVPTNGSNQNFLGDISGKIIVAAAIGLVGLFYEIIKIRYEHKQKAKLEQLNEDTQNKLLEKLERRQEKLLSQHGISDKRQDSRTKEQQEDIDGQNDNNT